MNRLAACIALFSLLSVTSAHAQQVNSGSDGSDGAFNPIGNVTIDMTDHPTGIYQYTSVNIPSGVTVTFTPNANNTPVVWLVQGNCSIVGTVSLKGTTGTYIAVGVGGPGGWTGGAGGPTGSAGQGPGGGPFGASIGGHGSYGSLGSSGTYSGVVYGAGPIYGNNFILPLLGGSGGAGSPKLPPYSTTYITGGGGGGAILIASSGTITISGSINCDGGGAPFNYYASPYASGGSGSGGAIRLLASTVNGGGILSAKGGSAYDDNYPHPANGGNGRVRFDAYQNNFSGTIVGISSSGFQPIIIPAAGQGIQLNIASIGGVAAPGNPSGVLANPDVIIAAQQVNPLPVVVNCSNIPLGTPISITVHPANGPDVVATANNDTGTLAASTATIPVNMPRGGGIIYATATTGITGGASTSSGSDVKNIVQTGWTAAGEKFVAMEITAGLGGKQHVSYLTESGKRYAYPGN